MLSLQNPLHSHLQNCIIISRMQIITANSKHCEVAAMHSNTFNTMQCISPNALYSPLDCNHYNALPPNPLHCSQCSVLHSTSCHQCTAMPSMHCRQCALAGIACFTACARLNHLLIPSNLLQQPCTVLQLNMLHCTATSSHCSSCTVLQALCCSINMLQCHCHCQALLLRKSFCLSTFFLGPAPPTSVVPHWQF